MFFKTRPLHNILRALVDYLRLLFAYSGLHGRRGGINFKDAYGRKNLLFLPLHPCPSLSRRGACMFPM